MCIYNNSKFTVSQCILYNISVYIAKVTTPVDDSETPRPANDSEKAIDDSVAIVTVVGCAARITDVINSLKKNHWLRWFRSVRNISKLVPIFEKINEKVEEIKFTDSKEFCELFLHGNVEDLKISLIDIKIKILCGSIVVIIGGFTMVVVGVILVFTPLALAVGGAAVISGTIALGPIVWKLFNLQQEKGELEAKKFLQRKDIDYQD